MKKTRKARPRRGPRHLRPRHGEGYWDIAVRAAREALHSHLHDRYWEDLEELRRRPEVQEAERVIWKALSDYLSAEAAATRLGRGRRKRRGAASRRKAARRA